MKIKKSVFALVLAVTLMAGIAVGATASTSTQKQIAAYLDYGATVSLNGVKQDFLDAKGDRVYVIRYGGTTYLPVRSMGNLFGLTVGYDAASNTVQLNQPTGVKLIDDIKPYYVSPKSANGYAYGIYQATSEGKTKTISGIDVTSFLDLWVSGGSSDSRKIGTKVRASFNLDGKYESVTFKCYCPQDAILRVYADNEAVQKEIQVRGSAVAQEYTVPVFGSGELTFEVEKTTHGEDTNMYIFNATVKPIPIGQ